MKKVLIFGIIIVLVIAYLVTTKLMNKTMQEKQAIPENIVSVATIVPVTGKIEGEISYTGNVEGIVEASIISQTSGIVEKNFMSIGKSCSKGQVLAVIQNEQQEAAVEQAKAQVLLAETNYEKANSDLKRIEKLHKGNVATLDNLEMAQLGVKSAMAQLKSAQAGLKVAQKQLDDTFIKATISGFIASKEIDIGGTVSPGMKIAHLTDISKLKIRILVTEIDIVKLQVGQEVDITIDALPNRPYKGVINNIGMVTESGMRSYPIEVNIQNSKTNEIKSGMFARCVIVSETKDDALIVPENALVIGKDGSLKVYAIENDKAILKTITTGLRNSGQVEILSGIDKNMKIVTEGKERLTDGVKIKEK